MNLLGSRSLSSILGAVVGILFLGACAIVLSLIVLLPITLMGGARNFTLSLPASFTINPSAYELAVARNPNVTAEIRGGTRSDVMIRGGSRTMAALTILVLIPTAVVAAIVLYRLRRIFRRLREGRPFLAENANDLRFIGITVAIGELVWAGLQYWSMRAVAAEVSSPQFTFTSPFPVNLPVVFVGLVLVVVAEVFREGSRMRSDLESAREIQFSLVAAAAYQGAGVSVESRMVPARDVGGDYYDIIDLGDGRIAVVVADVAGKGLPAALLMTLLRGSLQSLLSAGLRGTALIEALNRHLVANTPANRMITCFYAEIDTKAGRLQYVNAGHNPPYLFGTRPTRVLEPTGIVLGMIDGMPFETVDVEVVPGDRLLVYTDGISEATNAAGDEFGNDRLAGVVAESADMPQAAAVDTVLSRVAAFVGKAPQHDDMTLMLVAIQPARA